MIEPTGRNAVTVSRSRQSALKIYDRHAGAGEPSPGAQIGVDVAAAAGGICGREEMGLLRLTLAIL